jgi:CRP/FNR family transcriptional regulator
MAHAAPLRTSNFIARLEAAERTALMQLVQRRRIEKGGIIFNAGSPGKNVYFLENGQAKIYHLNAEGREALLWFCLPGEIFGLTEVCHGGGRQVYAQACEESCVLSVERAVFKDFLATRPAAAMLVIDVLSCRLRSLGHVIEEMVASDVTERVFQLIMRLAASYGHRVGDDVHLDIHITHQEMANMIGCTRQSVTSALGMLKRLGVLSFQNHHIRIHRDRLPGAEPGEVATHKVA